VRRERVVAREPEATESDAPYSQAEFVDPSPSEFVGRKSVDRPPVREA